MSVSSELEALIGTEVIIDVVSPFVYAGTLREVGAHELVLEDADVHDLRDSNTTRELYVVETRRLGVRVNRRRVLVRLHEIISVSRLSDVLL